MYCTVLYMSLIPSEMMIRFDAEATGPEPELGGSFHPRELNRSPARPKHTEMAYKCRNSRRPHCILGLHLLQVKDLIELLLHMLECIRAGVHVFNSPQNDCGD